jgi:cellobiose-specific phosphotransferase system component IIC
MPKEVKIQTPRQYLKDAVLWSAGINLVLNLLAGWLFYMKTDALPLQGKGSVNDDAAVMTFIIVLCSLLLAVPGIKKLIKNGQLIRMEGVKPLPQPFRWLLSSGLVLSLLLAFASVYAYVPLAVALLRLLGPDPLPLAGFLLFKALYAAVLAGTLIPLVDWLVIRNESGKAA